MQKFTSEKEGAAAPFFTSCRRRTAAFKRLLSTRAKELREKLGEVSLNKDQ